MLIYCSSISNMSDTSGRELNSSCQYVYASSVKKGFRLLKVNLSGISSLLLIFSIISLNGVDFSGQFFIPQYFCLPETKREPQAGQCHSKGLPHSGQSSLSEFGSFVEKEQFKQIQTKYFISPSSRVVPKNFNTQEV